MVVDLKTFLNEYFTIPTRSMLPVKLDIGVGGGRGRIRQPRCRFDYATPCEVVGQVTFRFVESVVSAGILALSTAVLPGEH